jgi:hypothetical protein
MSRKARQQELALIREKRTVIEMEVEQRRLAVAEKSIRAVEAIESWTPEIVSRAEWGIAEPGYNVGIGAGSISQLSDRQDGKDFPFIKSLYDVAMARGMARILSTANSTGVTIRENLTNYTVGSEGYEIKVGTKKKRKVPDGLIDAAQDVVDRFLDDHDWQGDYDRELFWRLLRDGERFLALYPQRNGRVKARVIEPEQVTDPGQVQAELLNRWGINPPCATSTTFGIHTADHDVETVYGYCIQHQDGMPDYLPAEYVIHSKVNVDRNVKRGITDFFAAWEWLVGEAKLMRNTQAGATAQAAIAWIEQYAAGTTAATVNGNISTAADYSMSRRNLNGGTRTDEVRDLSPGTVRHVSAGKEYLPGPMGAERGNAFLEVSAALLRKAGSRWAMPEYMISGDASNSNMASTIEAGTPFANAIEGHQGRFGKFQSNAMWRVLQIAWRAGTFDRFGLSWEEFEYCLEVIATPPPIMKPDPLPETQRREVLVNQGIMSKKTWTAEEGLDWDQEQANGVSVSVVGSSIDGVDGLPANAGPQSSGTNQETQAATPTASGEFKELSRRQWQRNIKAIDDVLKDVSSGKRTDSMAAEMLVSLGLDRTRAEAFIADAKDNGQVDDPEFVAASRESLPKLPEATESAYAAMLESATPEERTAIVERLWENYP